MNLFIPHDCDSCGFSGESKLAFRGPHVRQSCPGCDKHIKFIPKAHVPDYREIKAAIWSITKELPLIEHVKNNTGFQESKNLLEQNIAYWKVYSSLRIECGIDSVDHAFNH